MHTIDSTVIERDMVIGPSLLMRAVFDFLRVVAHSDSTVVITGESGTGKEVIATLIHQRSRPSLAALVSIYSRLLERIERRNYDVFSQRVSLSPLEKSWIVVRALVS